MTNQSLRVELDGMDCRLFGTGITDLAHVPSMKAACRHKEIPLALGIFVYLYWTALLMPQQSFQSITCIMFNLSYTPPVPTSPV